MNRSVADLALAIIGGLIGGSVVPQPLSVVGAVLGSIVGCAAGRSIAGDRII